MSGESNRCAGFADGTSCLDNAAQCVIFGAAYDNNLLCIGEKEVFVLEPVFEKFMTALEKNGATLKYGSSLLVFGWLSRRCERQADIYGCKIATSAAFISALEKVADLNGISRERPGFLSWWQHSTIADRIAFIRRMETDPALEPAFQRRLGWTKWSVTVGLIVRKGDQVAQERNVARASACSRAAATCSGER